VVGVTTPEDAKTVGFEYIELALQEVLPLSIMVRMGVKLDHFGDSDTRLARL
jgi:hypothetical protein